MALTATASNFLESGFVQLLLGRSGLPQISSKSRAPWPAKCTTRPDDEYHWNPSLVLDLVHPGSMPDFIRPVSGYAGLTSAWMVEWLMDAGVPAAKRKMVAATWRAAHLVIPFRVSLCPFGIGASLCPFGSGLCPFGSWCSDSTLNVLLRSATNADGLLDDGTRIGWTLSPARSEP